MTSNHDDSHDRGKEPAGAARQADPSDLGAELRALSRHDELVGLQQFIDIVDAVWLSQNGTSESDTDEYALANNSMFGRFVIRRLLGEGGFGVVFLAEDPNLNRLVALKLPRRAVLLSSKLRERFVLEARMAAGLDHPNIVPVYDAGEVGSIGYIVSAYCPGPTLEEWRKATGGYVEARIAALIVSQLADAAHHAHQRGVLHRDLKPSNVLMQVDTDTVETTVPLLTDFGLAKQLDSEAGHTASGAHAGTTNYMAPEQLTGKRPDVGAFTDTWALGVILYELLTGQLPFDGDDEHEMVRHIREDEPKPVRALRSDVPRDLENICLKCLEKVPARRYESAADLATDLRCFLEGDEVKARPLGRGTRYWRTCRRHPVVASLAAALIFGGIGSGAGITWQWRRAVLHAEQVERNLIDAEHNQVNWAWVLEEFHHLGFSNDATNHASRESLKLHYQALLDRSDPDTLSVEFLAARTSFEARKAILSDDFEGARRLLDESYSQWRSVLDRSPTNRTAQRAIANILYFRMIVSQKTNAPANLSMWFGHESIQFTALLREEPVQGRICAEFALLLKQRGDCLFHLGYKEESVAAYEAAIRLWSPLCDRFTDSRQYPYHHAEALLLVATRKLEGEGTADALKHCQQADEILRRLLVDEPSVVEYRRLHAQIQCTMGKVAQEGGDSHPAILHYEVARVHLHDLYYYHLATTYDTNLLISTLRQLGELHEAIDDTKTAILRYELATHLSHSFAMDRKLSEENARSQGVVAKRLGDLQLKDGQRLAAVLAWKQACHIFKYPLVNDNPSQVLLTWADAWEQIARANREDGDEDEARLAYFAARKVLTTDSFTESQFAARDERLERIDRALSETIPSNQFGNSSESSK